MGVGYSSIPVFQKWAEMAKKFVESLFWHHDPPPRLVKGGGLKILVKKHFLSEMVWNCEKLVKSLFVKDQGSISRTILEQFGLDFLVVKSEMSTVVL